MTLLLAIPSAHGQDLDDVGTVSAVALRYIEGWYAGNATQVREVLHPELVKRIAKTDPQTGKSYLVTQSLSDFINLTAAHKEKPGAKQQKDITVLDVYKDAAMARVSATAWFDYMQLAKWEGKWMIFNLLWERKDGGIPGGETLQSTQNPDDAAAVKAAALEYIDGWYAGDAKRIEKVLNPELVRRTVRTEPQTGTSYLIFDSAKDFIDLTGEHKAKSGVKQQKDIAVLDVFRNAAMVKVTASGWVDYLQMARWNGKWKIVDILWEPKEGGTFATSSQDLPERPLPPALKDLWRYAGTVSQ
jgi:predicted lipid-binding transport protein (Tim44 family)